MKSTRQFLIPSAVLLLILCFAVFRSNRVDKAPATSTSQRLSAPNDATLQKSRLSSTIVLPATTATIVGSQQSGPAKVDARFPGATILETRETAPDHLGQVTRVDLLKTKMKYPLIRVESVFQRDPQTQTDTLLRRREMVADHVVIELAHGKQEEDLLPILESFGAKVRRKLKVEYSETFLVEVPHPTIDAVPEALTNLLPFQKFFSFAEPDFLSHKTSTPDDPGLPAQWQLNNVGQTGGKPDADIDAVEAWSVATGSNNMIIAISDTGIDYNHSDLSPNVWENLVDLDNAFDEDGNGYPNDLRGWNFAYGNNDPNDDEGHGTFVSGIIGARGNNGTGIAGLCWTCKLMPLKTLDYLGSGYNSDIAEAFTYARIKGVRIINASHAGPGSATLQAAVNELEVAGVLLVAAADNDARNEDLWKDYPACYPNKNIIAVGASDHDDNIAYFSNYGAKTIDLFAPGDSVWSTKVGNGYGLDSGTSFATPQVTGVAGLIRVRHPFWTCEQIKAALINSVDVKNTMLGKCVSGGRLNANRALLGIYTSGPGSLDNAFVPRWSVGTGSILSGAVQKDGKLIVVGTFNNFQAHRVTRFTPAGALDLTFKPGAGANDAVQAVEIQADGKIVIGGNFTKFNNLPRNHIARLNINGTLDSTFKATNGPNGQITSLLIQPDGKIILAGSFTSVNGINRENIARLNPDGSLDESFIPPYLSPVQCLALEPNGKILFAGNTLGRLNTDGTTDSNFHGGANVNGPIRTIAVDGGDYILIGGYFTTYDNVPRAKIARVLPNGSLDTTFDPGSGASESNAHISAIALQDDCTILASGDFKEFEDTPLTGIVRLNSVGGVDENFEPGLGNYPGANIIIPLRDGRVYLGGGFTNYSVFSRRFVARIVGRDPSLGTNVFTLSTTNLTFEPAGGSTNVLVTTSGCANWKTHIGTNNWIAIADGAFGIGSSSVNLVILPNTNAAPRSAIVVIAGINVTVRQGASYAPQAFFGKTLVMNQRVLITSPVTNGFVSRILTTEDFGTFSYTFTSPTNASLTINDDQGTAIIYLSFTTPMSGSYTNTRGSFGNFTLYPTRPDFNGDARPDLLWINSTNALRAWFMDGTNFLGANGFSAPRWQPLSWKLVGENDFDHDGQTDLLWQNSLGNQSIWLMNQTNLVRNLTFGTSGTWKVIGLADLNYDGQKDLIYQSATGLMQCRFLQGTNRLNQVKLNNGKPVPLSLKPIGFDDFNRDGQADLLWQSTSNVLSVWTMVGTNFTTTNTLNEGAAIASDWKAVGIGDFNYDGNSDVVFENTAGELWVWLMNKFEISESFWLQPGQPVDAKWRIAGPK